MMNNENVNVLTDLMNKTIVRGFLDMNLMDSSQSQDQIYTALVDLAYPKDINDWTALRNGIAYYCHRQGQIEFSKKIYGIPYPIRAHLQPTHLGQKSAEDRLIRLISTMTGERVKHELTPADKAVIAISLIVYYIGCRPEEITSITVIDPNRFEVIGISHFGEVPGNRLIEFELEPARKFCEWGIKVLHNYDKALVNKAISRFTTDNKKMGIRTSALELMRHQKGCELKAAGVNIKTLTYLMGYVYLGDIADYRILFADDRPVSISAGIAFKDIEQLIQ